MTFVHATLVFSKDDPVLRKPSFRDEAFFVLLCQAMEQALLIIDVQPCFDPPQWQVDGIAHLAPTMLSIATVERHERA
jgi:hypothetical protein